MLVRRRYVVALVAAVLAGVVVLVVSITSSTPHAPVEGPPTPAHVTPFLAALPTPPGFTRGPCSQVGEYGAAVCYRRSRSIVITPAVMSGLLRTLRAKLDTHLYRTLRQAGSVPPTPSNCHPTGRYAIQHANTPRLALIACNEFVVIGSHQLQIAVTSLVLADRRTVVATSKSAPNTPGGTQIAVTNFP